MNHLTTADIAAIKALSQRYSNCTAFALPQVPLTLEATTIIVKRTDKKCANWRDIRANFNPATTDISIESAGIDFTGLQNKEEITAFLMSQLVHEATHAVTCCSFDKADVEASILLNKIARTSGLSSDYLAYIAHPVEAVAHGAMLAIDVYNRIGHGRTWLAFLLDVRNTWSMNYIISRLNGIGMFRRCPALLSIIFSSMMTYRRWQ